MIDLDFQNDYLVNEDLSFNGHMTHDSSGFFRSAITKIFKGGWTSETSESFHVTAEAARIYQLRKPKIIFQSSADSMPQGIG